MIICVCRRVNDKMIKEAGATSLEELQCKFRIADVCGACAALTRAILSESDPIRTRVFNSTGDDDEKFVP